MQIFAKTDIGKERKLNEDYFYASKPEDKIKLFILALLFYHIMPLKSMNYYEIFPVSVRVNRIFF